MKNTAIYPGTFNPITYGHIDLIHRAAKLFDHIIIAVATSTTKSPVFSLETRINMISQLFADQQNISVAGFDGLIVNFMREREVKVLLRGIRTVSDMEQEFRLATMNRYMYPEMDTVFLTPDPKFTNISSTIVREIAKMGGDLTPFVPKLVQDAFKQI
jgi:pantetheine-phosphate adenylyltransferase